MNKGDVMAKRKKKPIRFTAMSKMIGLIIIFTVFIVIGYSMYEMHITRDLTSLQYLICGVLAILGSYIGFYINMAKAEHIEDKKNQIKKEIEIIRCKNTIELEEQERIIQELEDMNTKLDELNHEEEINTQ